MPPCPSSPPSPDLHPSNFWQTESARAGQGGKWWCLHTKPRQEKATRRDLRSRGVAYYLPQVAHEDRTPQGRKTRSIIPLFSSYLFLHGNDRDRVEALKGNRLANVLEVADQEELRTTFARFTRCSRLALGRPRDGRSRRARVRIKTGPLTGIEGTVIRRGKRDQFVAIVHFLGRGATVDL